MKITPIEAQPRQGTHGTLPPLSSSALALEMNSTGNAVAGMLNRKAGASQPIRETRQQLYEDFEDDDQPRPVVRTLADLAKVKPHVVPRPRLETSSRPSQPPKPSPRPQPAVLQESLSGAALVAAALFKRK